jgi:hypothetical protein
VFLDHAGAQCDRCYGRRVIERVIGQARQDIMPGTDIREGPNRKQVQDKR